MNLTSEKLEAKSLIFKKLDLDADITISVFETTIRILGGMLSAYELDGDRKWINLSVTLADKLLPAFQTPHGIPLQSVNLKKFIFSN